MKAHKRKINRTAHFYTLGEPGKHIKRFWIVCHGYGQLASKFIYKFDSILDEETFVLAPEALSRFYFGGFTGKVGASWMTKDDRLDEIEDYCNYLQELFDEFRPQLAEDAQVYLLGFSQGTATQSRWAMRNAIPFHHLILWSGDFATDINYLEQKSFLENKSLHLVYGLQDEFLNDTRIQNIQNFAQQQELNYQTRTFEGKHVLDREALKKLRDEIYQ